MKISVRSMNLGLPMYEGIKTPARWGWTALRSGTERISSATQGQEDGERAYWIPARRRGSRSAITAGIGSRGPQNRPIAIQRPATSLRSAGC